MTNEERLRALKCNLKNWSWDVCPIYKIEKEDAAALLELLSNNTKEERTNGCKDTRTDRG